MPEVSPTLSFLLVVGDMVGHFDDSIGLPLLDVVADHMGDAGDLEPCRVPAAPAEEEILSPGSDIAAEIGMGKRSLGKKGTP